MHNCTATIQEEESHAAKIIHFHGPEKAFGSQHTIQKEDLGRIRWLFVLNPRMHTASTQVKTLLACIWTKKATLKHASSLHPCPCLSITFNRFTFISSTYSPAHLFPLKPLTDKQPFSRGTPCYNVVEENMSTSRHLYMLSFFITTPWVLSCHFSPPKRRLN